MLELTKLFNNNKLLIQIAYLAIDDITDNDKADGIKLTRKLLELRGVNRLCLEYDIYIKLANIDYTLYIYSDGSIESKDTDVYKTHFISKLLNAYWIDPINKENKQKELNLINSFIEDSGDFIDLVCILDAYKDKVLKG